MLTKRVKWIAFLLLIGFVYFKIYIRGNNRFTIYHHHEVWLPSSTQNIKFVDYPDFPNITDDIATNLCQMDKDDYFKFLRKQEYSYLIRVDTSEDKKSWTYIESEYAEIPDSLVTKLPVQLKCKSTTGDFLIITTDEINKNTVKVELHTDWN
jgi:CO dehydrogenase/acetyl-CoA synthase beta subunit